MPKILLVDDHPLMTSSLINIFKVGNAELLFLEANSYTRAMEIASLEPELYGAVLDISLGDAHFDGLDLASELRRTHPHIRILVLSMHDAQVYSARAKQAGAQGYLCKQSSVAEMQQTFNKILQGEECFLEAQPGVLSSDPLAILSNREFRIFTLLGEGHSPKAIADKLFISARTVETHRANIRSKLGIDSAAELISIANRYQRSN